MPFLLHKTEAAVAGRLAASIVDCSRAYISMSTLLQDVSKTRSLRGCNSIGQHNLL